MKRICIFLLLAFVVISCTERMTKQFIVPELNSKSQEQVVDNWTIKAPTLIAFKNKNIKDIDTTSIIYWLTIKAFTRKTSSPTGTLSIDSVGVEFVDLDSIVWRTPSRVVPFKKNHLAFDFFRNQGVEIPDSVTRIRLFFDAVITDSTVQDFKDTSHKVSFDMIRQDTTQMTPFIIQ